jgi:hypothetical protein
MGFKSINANLDGTINMTRNLLHPDHYDFETNPKRCQQQRDIEGKNKAKKIRHK